MRLKFLLFSLRKLYLAVFIGLSVGAVAQTANTSTPDTDSVPVEIFGTWEVTSVHIDAGTMRTLLYQHNDPRLKGRIFNFAQERFTSNTPEERACESPTIAARLRSTGLIESSMAGRAVPPVTPTSDDYHIQLPANASARAFTVRCNGKLWGGSLGRENGIRGAWLVALANDRLAIRWYDETILELRRVPADARPKASFNCTHASNASEKAICRSIPLAYLDVSVADAYRFAVREMKELGHQNALMHLQTQQRAWITQRNQCQSDVACLDQAMSSRLEVIEAIPRDE